MTAVDAATDSAPAPAATGWALALAAGAPAVPDPRGTPRASATPIGRALDETVAVGFWARVGAWTIDVAMIALGSAAVLGALAGIDRATGFTDARDSGDTIAGLVVWGVLLVASLAYEVAFETSARRGTPGKQVIGAVVVDRWGDRLGPWQSSGRWAAHLACVCTAGVGYLFTAWNGRRRGMHDALADTFVVRRRSLPATSAVTDRSTTD